ncbi:TOBE domain-containing protein [Leptothrix discophora]|uniref:TOBE domain-containing protein n=1 Tax=Leptothrix discophora TaxID=89 RepID=A0ABT9G0L4_LEPDI|nr:TOBE domain-containing protein [Leptothrix discophora]MDP4300016.1 TOBE domain-containing protein [Leptothrix discophora]
MTTRRRDSKARPLAVKGSLWITSGDESLGGHGRIALLRSVAEHGSITQAAKAYGMSYKAAWDAIDTMNRVSGEPVVERSTGGRGGGSTRLTAHGERLVQRYTQLDAVHQRFVAMLAEQAFDLDQDYSLLQALNMKTTARNQFLGTVTAVRSGAVNDEVEVTLAGGTRVVAIIPRDGTESLGLRTQLAVIVLVPSAHVLLATGLDGARLSARNQLAGTVAAVRPGAVNAEVVLALTGGGQLVATVTSASVDTLGLAEGIPAVALVKASDVILAVLA